MKICLIMPNAFPVPATKGGAVETLANNFIDENEKEGKIDITCVSIYEEKAVKLSKKYKYTKYHYIPLQQRDGKIGLTFDLYDETFKAYMDQVYEAIKDEKFDYIIIEGGDILGYEYLIKRLPNQKFIAHIHGLAERKEYGDLYDYFLSISEYVSKQLIKNGVPSNKIKLLYNAIPRQDFDRTISEEEKEKLRTKYNIKKEDTVILFCGRTIPEKGVKELLLAFKQMKQRGKCKLLIVGNSNFANEILTDYDKELKEISKDISNQIIYSGFVPNKELYKLHNISDIAVVPSIWEEPFGLVVIEAMSSGLPLVVTKSGGIPEIVDQNCAFILEKNEKLIENMAQQLDYLIEHPEIRVRMGNAGKERAKKFGMEQYISNFYALMENMK